MGSGTKHLPDMAGNYLFFVAMRANDLFLSSLLWLMAFLLVPVLVNGQADSVAIDSTLEIPFVANWSVNDSFRYHITDINVTYTGDSMTVNDTVRSEADFIVVDSTAEGYVVAWEIEKKEDDPFGPAFYEQLDPVFRAQLDSMDFRPKFSTTPYGEYTGIANADELLLALDLISPAIADYILSQDTSALFRYMDSTQRAVLTRFAVKKMKEEFTPEKLTQDYLSAIPYFLSPLGAQYRLYDTTQASIEIESNLPGITVLNHTSYYLDNYYPEDGYVHLKIISAVDRADGILVVGEALRRKGFDEDKIQDFIQNGSYREREDNDYYYYYGYGLPEGIDCYREIIVEAPDEESVTTIRHLIINILREEQED